jgi:hypothetical protein
MGEPQPTGTLKDCNGIVLPFLLSQICITASSVKTLKEHLVKAFKMTIMLTEYY